MLLIILSTKKGLDSKEKVKLTFLRLFDNTLNLLFLKKYIACNDCFGLFTKIKKGQGLAFGAHFLHDFPLKMILI